MGMSFHAEVSLMDGIEESYTNPAQARRAAALLPPAVTWIMLAGQQIYNLCRTGKLDHGRGFSLDRWADWKQDFRTATSTSQIAFNLRMEAVSAVSKMEDIENAAQRAQS